MLASLIHLPVFDWEIRVTNAIATVFSDGVLHTSAEVLSDFKRTAPFIIFLIIALLRVRGWRATVLILLIAALGVALSDSISYQIIKRAVMRPRPNFLGSECLEHNCWGFVSSHAANVFCAALILAHFEPRWKRALYFIASLVSFSRIALADHFPLDVAGGAMLGLVVGFLLTRFFQFFECQINILSKPKQVDGGFR